MTKPAAPKGMKYGEFNKVRLLREYPDAPRWLQNQVKDGLPLNVARDTMRMRRRAFPKGVGPIHHQAN